jgi:branched-subunit amino acid transport protein
MIERILADGFGGYLILTMVGFAVHEPWRWAGLLLGRNLSVESEVFHWVRAVATALVAGLVVRLIFFPSGALLDIPLTVRLVATVAGIAIFLATKRNLGVGIAGGTAVLIAARFLFPNF